MTRPKTVHPELVEGGGRVVRQAHHERPHYDALFFNEVLGVAGTCRVNEGIFSFFGAEGGICH